MEKVETPEEAVRAVKTHGGLRPAARATGKSFGYIRKRYLQAVKQGLADPLVAGRPPTGEKEVVIASPTPQKVVDYSKRKGVRRYLLTSAQNNTQVHEPTWRSLQLLAEYYSAELLIGRYIYIKSGLGALGDKATFISRSESLGTDNQLVWDKRLDEYINDNQVKLHDKVTWCGQKNISPTAVDPLSGYESFTGTSWGIFPHAKVAMQPIAGIGPGNAKFNFTTGTITKPNYIQRKAGQKAEFHHVYGALLLEIDEDGTFFPRHVIADSEGTLCDLDVMVKDGKVTTGNRVKTITWGDIHERDIQPEIRKAYWHAADSVMNQLRPESQFMHDTLDFYNRNHHNRHSFSSMYSRFINGQECVKSEVESCCEFLDMTSRDWCNTYVVASNHDDAASRWLDATDYSFKDDLVNSEFYLECQLARVHAIQKKERFTAMQYFIERFCETKPKVLGCNESLMIGGVEMSQHGHNGPNGARGSVKGFAKLGFKLTQGHIHSPTTYLGVCAAGLTARLNQDYAQGPSSWDRTFVVQHQNCKRAQVFVRTVDGVVRWRVPMSCEKSSDIQLRSTDQTRPHGRRKRRRSRQPA